MSKYPVLATLRIHANFKDLSGTDVDPFSVQIKVKVPSGDINTYSYAGGGGAVFKGSTGNYYLDYNPSSLGRYWYQWLGSGGNYNAAYESTFEVPHSEFV